MLKHLGPISGVSTFGDQWVATAGYDNRIILWTPERTAVACGFHDHLANQCTFSPDGRFLASASSDYTARLWDVPSLRLKVVFDGHCDDVEMVSFDPAGERVATCSRDRAVRVFALDGRCIAQLQGHQDDVISVGWDRGTGQVISSSDDGTIKRWDPSTGQLIATIDLDGVQTDTLAITEDGLVFAGNDQGELLSIGGTVERIQAHDAGVKRLIYSPEARLLVTMSYDRFAAFWRVGLQGQLSEVGRTALPASVWPRSAAFIGNAKLAAATFGSTFAIYDLKGSQWDVDLLQPGIGMNAVTLIDDETWSVGDAGIVFRNGEEQASMGSLCNFITPVGACLITGGQLGAIFDARTGRIIYQHRSPLNCAANFTHHGHVYAIVGTYTGEGLILKQTDGRIEFVEEVQLHDNAVKGVACSKTTIFSVCATGAAARCSIDGFAPMQSDSFGHARIANGCTHIGAETFASISRDLKLRIWNEGFAREIRSPHSNSIKCIAASPDGRWIATGSYTGFIAIYDRQIEDWLPAIRPTLAGISSLHPGKIPGSFLASSYDGQVYDVVAAGHSLLAAA